MTHRELGNIVERFETIERNCRLLPPNLSENRDYIGVKGITIYDIAWLYEVAKLYVKEHTNTITVNDNRKATESPRELGNAS